MTISLKKHTSVDVLEIMASIRASEADDHSRMAATQLRHLEEFNDKENRVFFTASDTGGEPVAYVQLILRNADNDPDLANGKTVAHIHDLRVHSKWRRRGIALLVMQQLEREAIGLGLNALTLGVDSPNSAARNLYQNLGYQEFKNVPGRDDSELCLYLRKYIQD